MQVVAAVSCERFNKSPESDPLKVRRNSPFF